MVRQAGLTVQGRPRVLALGEFQVARKQILSIALMVLLAASLSALVAYRLGLRQSNFRGRFGSARSTKINCVDFHEAQSRAGETGCVSGRVLRAFISRGGNAFLDFCPDYRNCAFGAVVFTSDRSRFGDLETLAGRQVEIQGLITMYQGRAEIIIHDPDQIRVIP